jgi:hypothetical protein
MEGVVFFVSVSIDIIVQMQPKTVLLVIILVKYATALPQIIVFNAINHH